MNAVPLKYLQIYNSENFTDNVEGVESLPGERPC